MKFVFKVKIKKGRSAPDYIEAWKKGSAVIQESTGARGTVLYRKIDEPGTFWQSPRGRRKKHAMWL